MARITNIPLTIFGLTEEEKTDLYQQECQLLKYLLYDKPKPVGNKHFIATQGIFTLNQNLVGTRTALEVSHYVVNELVKTLIYGFGYRHNSKSLIRTDPDAVHLSFDTTKKELVVKEDYSLDVLNDVYFEPRKNLSTFYPVFDETGSLNLEETFINLDGFKWDKEKDVVDIPEALFSCQIERIKTVSDKEETGMSGETGVLRFG
ncbi:hypothetical protein GPK34_00615 [Secundilactobacillus kimchicus]|uniref:hypothetical protein n=1 Tax=Secundilactobacillus kimchicus TaxID=528209 RepID=UPI001C0098B9|nr:hypothetical protein [Secundilactobacillus kimchicus]MBT9670540.1 hypothetical protein [Secundilactobacillus kimchicus]